MIKRVLRVGWRGACCFATNRFSSLVEQLESSAYQEPLVREEREEETLRNYTQLTEESYMEQLRRDSAGQCRIDPSIVLMALPTLEKEEVIREHLLLLYPALPLLAPRELQLFFEFLLAHPLPNKPKIPPPRPLNHCEPLLVLLAEIYPKDFLAEWLKQVPLYSGNNLYLLAMGAFSVISGMSERARTAHRKVVERSLERVGELFEGEESEARLGVVLLGLEMNIKYVEQLLLAPYCLDFREIDGIKLSLLVIELDRYIKAQYAGVKAVDPRQGEGEREWEDVEIDEGVERQEEKEEWAGYVYQSEQLEHIKFKLEEYLLRLVSVFAHRDWKNVIKLHTLVRLFHVLTGKKLEKGWLRFSEKLFSFAIKKEQIATLANLTTAELVGLVEVMEGLKLNKPTLLKNLLVVLSDRLETASKEELIRLSKCLVTYVRVCEDYLVHFRLIVERRKLIFSPQDIDALNGHFRRVQVLFPKPLAY